MISIKQFSVIFLLVSGAITVWVPKVRNALTGATPEETQGSNGVDHSMIDGGQSTIAVLGSSGAQVPSQGIGSIDSVAGSHETQDSQASEDEDASLRNFGSRGRLLLLSDSIEEEEDQPEVIPASEHFKEWVSRHPLTGVMQSSRGNRAIFGGGFFKEDQALFEGWKLVSIHPEFVEVHGDDTILKIHLPRLGQGLEAQVAGDNSEESEEAQTAASNSSSDLLSENI
ncbi:MAG: hypothetical protein ACI87O_000380 [Planctomycetota bacterium]|jgi:hypothetical protein